MIRRLLSRLVLLTLLASFVATGWLLGTASGARVVIAYVSGITSGFSMRHESGSLIGPLQLKKIIIKAPAMRTEIDTVFIDWSPACLLVGELCLRDVRVNHVTVTLPAPAAIPPQTGKRRLPDISLPLNIDMGRLEIASLDLVRGEKSTHFTTMETAIAWQGRELRVDRLAVGMASWKAHAAGTITTTGEWPLNATLAFVTPRTGDALLSMRGSGDGTLMDTHLKIVSDGILRAELEGHVQPLQRGMPFTATLNARSFLIPPHGKPEKSAQLQNIALTGHGELLGQFIVEGKAGIDTPWTSSLPATLTRAQGTWRGLDRAEIRIDDPRLLASIVSDYRWLGGQHFRATVDVERLDLSLVNKASPSQLAGTLQIEGAIDKKGTVIDIGIDSLDGRFRQWPLATQGTLHWRDSHWIFDPLELLIGDNTAVVTGTLGDAWDANAALTLNNLKTLQPAFAGSANGGAKISGEPTNPHFALTLAARDLLLPAVTLPAPIARKVQLPAADWKISGIATLGDIELQYAHTEPAQAFDMHAAGNVSWRGPLQWDIATQLAHLSLHDLLPELLGVVEGSFATGGTLSTQLDDLHIDTKLRGTSLDQPLTVEAKLDYAPKNLRLERLKLVHGNNRLLMSTVIDNRQDEGTLVLDLDLAAPAIGNSLRDISGAAQLQATASGLQSRPTVQLKAALDTFAWQDLQVGKVALTADVRDGFLSPSTFALAAENISQAEQLVRSIAVSASGTRDAHSLTLAAQAAKLDLHATLSGAISSNRRETFSGPGIDWQSIDWLGTLENGRVSIDDWLWKNTGTAAIHYRDQQVTVAPHCWSDNSARACLSSTAEIGNSGKLDAEIFHLPFETLLGDLLPIDTRVEGKVGGIVSLAWQNGGLSRLRTDIRNENIIRLALADDEEKRTLGEIDDFHVDANIDDRGGSMRGIVRGERVGTLQAQATLGPGNSGNITERALDAHLQARDIQFGLLEAFTYQLRDIGGTIGGNVDVRGTPAHPQISGRVDLVEGRAGFTRLPVNLVDINLGGQFSGAQAGFSGSLRTAESTGLANIEGNVQFSGNDWQGRGKLTGDGLVFSSLPEFQFTTAPDISLTVDSQHLGIDGTVRVPAGRIELKALPAQSVRRSRDVVLVQEERLIADTGLGLRQRVDVNFVLGDDVYFRAFGGDGRLAGDLRVRSTPELPLLVNGELHVHDGKYAAFGQSLNLKQADIIFNGPADQPLIDAVASRNFDDAAVREVGLRLTGSLRAPQTTLWSAPPLPDEEALSWLATGRPLSDGPINLRGEAAQAALSLGVAQGSALLTAAGQEIGLQDVQLATSGDGDTAEVQVGTNVNEKIYVGFNRRVFTGDESVLVRLHLTRRLMLEALSGLDSALDIFYTFEF